MTDLKVDGAGLNSLVTSLRNAADTMREATGSLDSADTAGLGHHEIDGAAGHFSHEWGYGIGQLHKASDNVAKQLDEGVRHYGETDKQLADQLRKAMNPS